MTLSHADARAILSSAFPGRSPAWYQAVQAVALGEGGYGNGWKNADVAEGGVTYSNRGEGSNNWGAIQCGHSTTPGGDCGAGCFPNIDHHADGTPYQGCFKVYATPEEGAAGFVYVMTDNGPGVHNRASVEAALEATDANGAVSADAIAQAMHDTGYFEASVDSYAQGIARHAAQIAQALGEPLVVLRAGDVGPPATGGGIGVVEVVCGVGLVIAAYFAAGGRIG